MRAEAVREVLGRKNLTRHGAHTRLDLSREAVSKMWDGRDVSLETVEKFARAVGEDVNEWRERWGYERLTDVRLGRLGEPRWAGTYGTRAEDDPDGEEEPGAEWFVRELRRLGEKHGRPIPVDLTGGLEGDGLTMKRARELAADLERQLEEGII